MFLNQVGLYYKMNLEELKNNLLEFKKEYAYEFIEYSLGKKEEMRSVEIFQKYKHLFTKDKVELVKELYEKEQSRFKKRQLRYLYDSLMGDYIGEILSPLSDEYATFIAKSEIEIDGKKIKFKDVHGLIQNEPDQSKRKQIYDKGKEIREKSKEYAEQLFEKDEELIKSFGYDNELEALTELHETDYDNLKEMIQNILRETKEIFDLLFDKFCKKANLDYNNVNHFDITFLLKGERFDKYFKAEEIKPKLKEYLSNLGFDFDNLKNITFHIDKEENKEPRAFCYPIIVPEEIHVLMNPEGGRSDFQILWHEVGHALHYAFTFKDLEYEFKYYGLFGTTEIHSFLFEHLFFNREFITHFFDLSKEDLDEYLSFMKFWNLLMLRRYSSKLLYELKFYKNDLRKLDENLEETSEEYNDKPEMFSSILTQSTKCKYDSVSYVTDFDRGLYSAEYLKAWMFEPQLRSYLETNFGSDWFLNKEAGEFLRMLWKDGNKYYPEEIAEQIGMPRLNESYLIKEFV